MLRGTPAVVALAMASVEAAGAFVSERGSAVLRSGTGFPGSGDLQNHN